jgi:hypothetical protein
MEVGCTGIAYSIQVFCFLVALETDVRQATATKFVNDNFIMRMIGIRSEVGTRVEDRWGPPRKMLEPNIYRRPLGSGIYGKSDRS